jgi:hypothetical protein
MLSGKYIAHHGDGDGDNVDVCCAGCEDDEDDEDDKGAAGAANNGPFLM